MSKCHHCQIEILDHTDTCPLCQGVLEIGGETNQFYPDIQGRRKKLFFFRRIFLFLSIMGIVLCLFIDYHVPGPLDWSLIASGGILLALFVTMVLTDPRLGYRSRIFYTICSGFAYVFFIDYITGFDGWSLDFVLPGVLFFVNFVLIFLMIYNHRSWQSYMIYQIGIVLVGIIPMLLIRHNLVRHPLISELAFGSSIFLFIGTLIMGGQAARQELMRRFYI